MSGELPCRLCPFSRWGGFSGPRQRHRAGHQTAVGRRLLQGVTQHRVDKINQFYNPTAPVNYDGEGITVGVLSDSFASNAAALAAWFWPARFFLALPPLSCARPRRPTKRLTRW